MTINPNTPRSISFEDENASLFLGQANGSLKLSQNSSESKTTQISLNFFEQQALICANIKNLIATLSPNTDHTKLASKVESLIIQLKTINVTEEIQNHLNHFQLSLHKEKFQDLSDKIRDVMPFMWNDLPKEIQHYVLSQVSFEQLLKIHPSKEFRVGVDLEIIKRINNNKIPLDLHINTFAILMRTLKKQGVHLTYLGLISGKCSLDHLVDVIKCCPNLEEIKLDRFPRLMKVADTHAVFIAKLAEQSKLSQLKKLEFMPGSIKLPGLKAIANAPLKTLISLKLIGNELGNSGFACICQSPTLINLKSLDFSTNQLKAEGLQPIAEAKFKLQELYLRNNQIVSFANKLDTLKDLKILDLSENQMNAGALETILKLSEHALTLLDLSHNHLTDESLPQVIQLENSKLTFLKLADNNISSQGIEKIILLIPHLSGLYLDNNKELDSWGLKLILKENPILTELGLSGTHIGEEGVMKLLDFKNFKSVKKLNIGRIDLSEKFWTFFSEFSLQQNSTVFNLRELEITYLHKEKEKLSHLISFFQLKKIHCFFNPKLFFGKLCDIRDVGKPYGCEASLEVE